MIRGLSGTVLWACLAACVGIGLFVVKTEVKDAEMRLAGINHEIQRNQEAVHVLKAEWAFLNDPERLRALAEKHLGLRPVAPAQIATLSQLAPGGAALPLLAGDPGPPPVVRSPPPPAPSIGAPQPPAPASKAPTSVRMAKVELARETKAARPIPSRPAPPPAPKAVAVAQAAEPPPMARSIVIASPNLAASEPPPREAR